MLEISLDYKEHFTYPGGKITVFQCNGGGGFMVFFKFPFLQSCKFLSDTEHTEEESKSNTNFKFAQITSSLISQNI